MPDSNQTLGKYRILEELGHGGFATVYKAEDTSLERTIALKVLDPVFTRDAALIGRFQQEAKVTAKLFHPNIAALFEVGQSEGRYFLAMQYIAGRNLRDLLQTQGLLPLDQIAAIIQQIGAALDYAHVQGIVHRDVKPSNIIVDEAGHATLTDFGIVKVFEATTLQTTNGAILGTPAYASPEQVDSKPLDKRSDLYSFGVVAYELCTNKVPFAADTVPSLYYKIAHETPLAPSQANARVAGSIETVLFKALAKDRDQRYQSGKEFSAALSAAIEQVIGEHLAGLYQEAKVQQTQGDLDGAEDRLRQVLAIQPDHTGAQTLLININQQREAQQRYQQLSDQVRQMHADAIELQQANPMLNDPDQIFGLFSPAATKPVPTQSAVSGGHNKALWISGVVIAIVAAGLALVGIPNMQAALAGATAEIGWTKPVADVGNMLGIGHFYAGVSAGLMIATVIWLIVFYFSTKRKA